jgi:DNA topoisomerase-2
MLLVNGARGIGTGYSTFLPCYNPADLKSMLLRWLDTGSGLGDPLVPWIRGFQGKVTMEDAKSCVLEGKWSVAKDTMTISELPVGSWSADVRETLDKLLSDGSIRDYTDTSTDQQPSIQIKLGEDKSAVDKILRTKWKLTNMHAFNSKCVIHKYETPNEILKEFADVRLDLYAKRRDHLLKELRDALPYHENVVRFIRQQSQDKPVPDLRRKMRDECDNMLSAEKFTKIKDGYDYLMNLPIASITLTNAEKHEKALVDLVRKIGELEARTPKDMWKSELSAL